MKKPLFLIVFLSITLYSFGQGYLGRYKITDKVLNQMATLYLSERYKDCVDSCGAYVGYRYYYLGDESHPYRDWEKKHGYKDLNDIEDIAAMTYLGCVSAYQYTLSTFDASSIVDAIEWARVAAAIYADYLNEKKPDGSWSAEKINNYIVYGERGIVATQCGKHFLKIMDEDRWVKQQNKWFDKTSDKIYDALYRSFYSKEFVLSDYPLLQYKISTIMCDQMLMKGNYKAVQENFENRLDALTKLIQLSGQGKYSSDIYFALNSLTTLLCTTVTDRDFCKKAGNNYERFCMENLIKLQDISYFLNGSTRYSQYSSYTLLDIQNSLDEKDCAIIHFEAPVMSGSWYYKYDLGKRYRNYALVITKELEIPELWHRGYINDTIVNDLSKIKEAHPDAKRFFYVGTPRMAFIDIAGTDDSIIRLHSLSQLLQEPNRVTIDNGVTFIGDINYSKTGGGAFSIAKDDEFGQLRGPAIELEQIKTLFMNVRSVCCDQATRSIVASEICGSKGIVHISTHGALLGSNNDVFSNEDLILKKNIMDNSRLILSGYNDTPNSPLSYLSGSDILKLKKIDASIVFLDACLSGQGAVGASGSVGMAEAFHLIGTQNVICYLEPVLDEIATRFSNRFYLELSKGASCHEAFYTAKKSINKKIKVVLWE